MRRDVSGISHQRSSIDKISLISPPIQHQVTFEEDYKEKPLKLHFLKNETSRDEFNLYDKLNSSKKNDSSENRPIIISKTPN
jgi:hypothetical protein